MDLTGLFEWSVLRWVALAGIAWALVAVVRRLLSGKHTDPYRVVAGCSCGWHGTVSKLKPRCSKCGAPLTLT